MGLSYEITRHKSEGFRRAWIKRRSASTGLYESGWLEITEFIKSWGTIKRSVDDERLNRFTFNGISVTVRNDTGAFNKEDNVNSLWYGYLTRYRTLLKIEGGYYDDSGNELPTDASLGIFVMGDEIPISAVTNSAVIRAKSIASVFDEVRAADVAGLGPTQTASELIARIRDHTDGSSNAIFQQFISLASWTIQTTTSYYNLATSTALGALSCWAFMERLAQAEGFVLMVSRSGGLEFRNRDERTATSAWHFRGLGFDKMSVIQLTEYKEAVNKLYNFFRVKYIDTDTSDAYVTAGTVTTVDPTSDIWKYGSRVYELDVTPLFFTASAATATVQGLADNLRTQLGTLKDEVKILAKFIPNLELLDKVQLSYHSADITLQTLWDQFNWDGANWADESGENFNWDQVAFKILSIETDLDQVRCAYTLRQL